MKKYTLAVITLVTFVLFFGVAVFNMPQTIFVEASGGCCNNISVDITVTGTGTVRKKPDIATVSLNIETKNKNLKYAQNENADIVRKLIDTLKSQNIPEQDITGSWFNIYPEYDYCGSGQRFSGHKVSNQLNIKVREIANVGKIIELSAAAGASIISGIQFGVENNSKAYNEALVNAIESAKQKAKILSTATGLNNLSIVSVKEIPMSFLGFERYDFSMCSSGAGNTSIICNDIEVSVTVEVMFVSKT